MATKDLGMSTEVLGLASRDLGSASIDSGIKVSSPTSKNLDLTFVDSSPAVEEPTRC